MAAPSSSSSTRRIRSGAARVASALLRFVRALKGALERLAMDLEAETLDQELAGRVERLEQDVRELRGRVEALEG